VKASLFLKNMLSLLDIDDDGDLDPSFFADDEAARFSRPTSGETIALCARWDADFSGSAEPAEIGSADHRPQRLSSRGQACRVIIAVRLPLSPGPSRDCPWNRR
jgi:hypothetical protein